MALLSTHFGILRGTVLATLSLAFLPSSVFAAGLVKQNIDTTDAMRTLANYDRGTCAPRFRNSVAGLGSGSIRRAARRIRLGARAKTSRKMP